MSRLCLSMLLAFALLGCSKLTGFTEVHAESYPTYSEAEKGGMLKRGWLPRELPTSATKIVEVLDIDSSEMWIRFNYADGGIDALLEHCSAHPAPAFPDKRRTKRNVPWWPQPLMSGNEGSADVSRWELHSCPAMRHAGMNMPAGIAVERTSRTAWYWVY